MNGTYIAGNWAVGHGDWFERICPASGAVSWHGHAASPEQVAAAITTARQALPDWRRLQQSDRERILVSYGEAIKSRREALATAICKDMGKVLWDALGEADAMYGKIQLSIRALHERAGEAVDKAAFGFTQLSHHPHGVMAVFAPFNFPGHLPNGHIVPALLAGNTIVLKPSELAPSVSKIMADAFEAAGLPEGVFNIVQGGHATGAALLNGDINGVLFTGSEKTGLMMHRHFAGRPEIMLALEMGGNNPLILWEPADHDAAADIAAQSAFLTTGQRCSCARRAILPEGAWGDAVVDGIVDRAKALKIGQWDEDNIFMGPLVSEDAAIAATQFQMNLAKSGAKSLRRLKRLERGGGFVSAGVIDVTDARYVADEELFGPLLQVYRVKTFDEALKVANDTRFGLSAGLVCDDIQRWEMAKAELRAGIVNRNRPTAGASGHLPFGGPGLSGNFHPGAYYAADYSAWPQASQIAEKAARLAAIGFPG